MLSIGDIIGSAKDSYVARRIMMHVLGYSGEKLLVEYDSILSLEPHTQYKGMLERVMVGGEPLAYVLGYERFFGLTFYVTEDTLIPRSETEQMVSLVLADLPGSVQEFKKILVDVGTGSGCIGISLLSQLGGMFSDAFLTDISPQALKIAEKNVKNLLDADCREKVSFEESDLLHFFSSYVEKLHGRFIIVTANLPYIPTTYEGVEEGVAAHEPESALFSGEDGLYHYVKLLAEIDHYHHKLACSFTVYVELITMQVASLITHIESYEGMSAESFSTYHDNITLLKISQ